MAGRLTPTARRRVDPAGAQSGEAGAGDSPRATENFLGSMRANALVEITAHIAVGRHSWCPSMRAIVCRCAGRRRLTVLSRCCDGEGIEPTEGVVPCLDALSPLCGSRQNNAKTACARGHRAWKPSHRMSRRRLAPSGDDVLGSVRTQPVACFAARSGGVVGVNDPCAPGPRAGVRHPNVGPGPRELFGPTSAPPAGPALRSPTTTVRAPGGGRQRAASGRGFSDLRSGRPPAIARAHVCRQQRLGSPEGQQLRGSAVRSVAVAVVGNRERLGIRRSGIVQCMVCPGLCRYPFSDGR